MGCQASVWWQSQQKQGRCRRKAKPGWRYCWQHAGLERRAKVHELIKDKLEELHYRMITLSPPEPLLCLAGEMIPLREWLALLGRCLRSA
jgi:hypothetical protein